MIRLRNFFRNEHYIRNVDVMLYRFYHVDAVFNTDIIVKLYMYIRMRNIALRYLYYYYAHRKNRDQVFISIDEHSIHANIETIFIVTT